VPFKKPGFVKKDINQKYSINMSPMIDVVFQILIFFIVTLEMDPSLDDIMRLPDAFKASRQEELNMEIYLLPAGYIVTRQYQGQSEEWLNPDGTLNSEEDTDFSGQIAFAAKGNFDSMFVHLDDIPAIIDIEREKKAVNLIRRQNVLRRKNGEPPLTSEDKDKIKMGMALLMKVHKNVFYGRVLQVVDKARQAGVHTFAFVTDIKSAEVFLDRKRKR